MRYASLEIRFARDTALPRDTLRFASLEIDLAGCLTFFGGGWIRPLRFQTASLPDCFASKSFCFQIGLVDGVTFFGGGFDGKE